MPHLGLELENPLVKPLTDLLQGENKSAMALKLRLLQCHVSGVYDRLGSLRSFHLRLEIVQAF